MEWKDIWKDEPPRNEEIFFMTGDKMIHIGEIFSEEKLRKCIFRSFTYKEDYECDSLTKYENRVIYWFPIPKQPESSKREDRGPKIIVQTCGDWEIGCGTPNSMET